MEDFVGNVDWGSIIASTAAKPKRNKACCVAKCSDRTSRRYRFPKKYPEFFKLWVERIKPKNYEVLTADEIYQKYVVCDNHFNPSDIVNERRGIKPTAIPCLLIPGFQPAIELDESPRECPIPVKRLRVSGGLQPAISLDGSLIPTKRLRVSEGIETAPGPLKRPEFAAPGQTEFALHVSPHPQEQEDCYNLVETSETEDSMFDFEQECVVPGPPKVIATKKGIRGKRNSRFGQVNISRATDLTPKAKKYYTVLKKWSVNMANKQRTIKSYQKRLAHAEKLTETPNFSNLLKCVNNHTYKFIMCQIRNQQPEPKSRRFTLDQKILALSLLKGSGKGYKLLYKIFNLPASRSLNNLLQKLPMNSGINKHIFQSLQNQVSKMEDEREKICILLFDEIELATGLKYDRKADTFLGFQDDGVSKQPVIANYVNVFMLKGVYRQWKQPIVFSFNNGPIGTIILKNMIKNIINECFAVGLDVVATICDQGSRNCKAIDILLKETNDVFLRKNQTNPYFGFTVQGKEVIPLFDIPHLFKGIRNNLLNKELHFKLNGEEKTAKWAHIQQFYELDTSEPTLRLCYKLTDSHVYESKMNKMMVKNCTQVFSYTVGSLMKRITKWDIDDKLKLPQEAEDTSDLILFLDKLFDSFNVTRFTKVQAAKPLKCPITQQSPHQSFWSDAKVIVKSMKFHAPKQDKLIPVSIPCLKKLLFTIDGFSRLVSILLTEKRFKFVLSGAFNQDSLENLISYIRIHGVRNVNPDCGQFIDSFKSTIVNNCIVTHPAGSNCQKDIESECLHNLRTFLTGEIVAGATRLGNTENVLIPKRIVSQKETRIGRCTLRYMSGAIVKILLKSNDIKNCKTCINNLLKKHGTLYEDEEIFGTRQYKRGNLIRPGDSVSFLITRSLNYLFYLIPRFCTVANICETLHKVLLKELSFNVLNCPKHKLGQRVCKLVTRCSLYWWSKSVNKILKGKDSKFAAFLSRTTNTDFVDPIKKHALKLWENRRKNIRK